MSVFAGREKFTIAQLMAVSVERGWNAWQPHSRDKLKLNSNFVPGRNVINNSITPHLSCPLDTN